MSDHISETATIEPDGGDPSMEDILASIRRIIADDTVDNTDGPGNEPDHMDLRDFAATPQVHKDDNSVLVTAEPRHDLADSIDLDDILIMEDDDFAADDLEIPSVDVFAELADVAPEVVGNGDSPDDLEAEIAAMLKKRDAAKKPSPDIIEETEIPEDDVFVARADIADMIEVAPVPVNPYITQLVDLTAPVTADPVARNGKIDLYDDSADLSDDDIFSALDLDMDLVLGESVNNDSPPVIADPVSLDEADSDDDLLNMIQQSLVSIEAPSEAKSLLSVRPAKTHDNLLMADDLAGDLASDPFGGSDDLIDLVGELMNEPAGQSRAEDAAPEIMKTESQNPEAGRAAIAHKMTAIADVAGESDIDLVKSLMAELTDEPLHDDMDVFSALDVPAPAETHLLPEAQLVDDILELTIDDQAQEMDAESAAITAAIDVPEADEPDDALADLSQPDITADRKLSKVFTPDPGLQPEKSGEISLLDIAAAAELDAETPLKGEKTATQIGAVEAAQEKAFAEQSMETPDDAFVNIAVPAASDAKSSKDMLEIDAIFAEALTFDDDADLTGRIESVEKSVPSRRAMHDVSPPSDDLVDFGAMPAPLGIHADDTEAADDDDDMDVSAIFGDDLGLVPESAIFDQPLSAPSILAENIVPELTADAISAEALHTDNDDFIADNIDNNDDPAPQQETEDMPKLVTKDGILDDITESASAEAFASLNQLVEEKSEYEESGPRIGDLVQDALRPMLKEWLDANLKGIVERAVTKEVKRISSGK